METRLSTLKILTWSLIALAAASCATGPVTSPAVKTAARAPVDVRIDDTGVHPESITSTRAGDLITGSLKGRLFLARPGETVAKAWVEPSAENGLQAVFGVLTHEASNTLWVCSAPNPFALPVPGAVNQLVALNLATGAPKAKYPFPPGASVCNDMTVAQDGSVYVADTQGGRILVLPARGTALQVYGEDAKLRGIDGIAFSGDGKLYANNVISGAMYRIGMGADNRMTGITDLVLTDKLAGPDGLRLIEGNRFVQAEGGSGRIAEITIEGDTARVRALRTGLDSSPGVTWIGDYAYATEGKIRFMVDPNLKGQDPGPFMIRAIPLQPQGQ